LSYISAAVEGTTPKKATKREFMFALQFAGRDPPGCKERKQEEANRKQQRKTVDQYSLKNGAARARLTWTEYSQALQWLDHFVAVAKALREFNPVT